MFTPVVSVARVASVENEVSSAFLCSIVTVSDVDASHARISTANRAASPPRPNVGLYCALPPKRR